MLWHMPGCTAARAPHLLPAQRLGGRRCLLTGNDTSAWAYLRMVVVVLVVVAHRAIRMRGAVVPWSGLVVGLLSPPPDAPLSHVTPASIV